MNSQPIPPAKARLRRVMRGTEYFTLAFGSIVGVGWMVVIEQWFRRGGSAGAMLGFLLGGVALVPVVYVYGRLAERIPEAASEVAYTGAVFPRSVSFATGWAMTLTYVMVCPWETVAMCKITAYLFPELKTIELYQVGGDHSRADKRSRLVHLRARLAGNLLGVLLRRRREAQAERLGTGAAWRRYGRFVCRDCRGRVRLLGVAGLSRLGRLWTDLVAVPTC